MEKGDLSCFNRAKTSGTGGSLSAQTISLSVRHRVPHPDDAPAQM
jgi:hypothetical protein